MMPFLLQYVLILCNTIGTLLDSKYIDIGELTRLALGERRSSLDCTPVGHAQCRATARDHTPSLLIQRRLRYCHPLPTLRH